MPAKRRPIDLDIVWGKKVRASYKRAIARADANSMREMTKVSTVNETFELNTFALEAGFLIELVKNSRPLGVCTSPSGRLHFALKASFCSLTHFHPRSG